MRTILMILSLSVLSACGGDVHPPTLTGMPLITPSGPVSVPATASIQIPYQSGGSHSFTVSTTPLASGDITPTDLDFGGGKSCNYDLVLINKALTVQTLNSCSVADCSICPGYGEGYVDYTFYL